MNELMTVMRRLRGPGGCPWDQEQTHESLRPYLLEEAAEAVDAVSHPERAELAAVRRALRALEDLPPTGKRNRHDPC